MLKSGVTVTGSKYGNYKVVVEIDKAEPGLNQCIGSTIIELPDEYSGLVKEIESAVKRTINKWSKELTLNK